MKLRLIRICLLLFLLSQPLILQGQSPPRPSGLGAFSAVTGGMSLGSAPMPIFVYGGSATFGKGPSFTIQHRLNASAPIFKNESESYSLSLGGGSLQFGESVKLSSATVVPKDFYRLELGGQYSRQLEAGRNINARVSAGSASDTPFRSAREMTFSLNASYSYPGSETSHWVFTMFASNNNPIINYIPIPGFIYFYRTANFIGMFGVPFISMQWTPLNPWALSLSIFGPSVTSEIIYGPREALQSFIGYNWSQQSFLRHDRNYDEDRLFLSEMRIYAGVRSPINEKLSAELQGGFTFSRDVYEGSRFDKRDHGSAELDDAYYAQWNFRYIF